MTRSLLLTVLLLLAACGDEPPPPAADEAGSENASREHFLSEHQKALERAKALQGELNASVKQRLEDIDKQTRDARDEDGR